MCPQRASKLSRNLGDIKTTNQSLTYNDNENLDEFTVIEETDDTKDLTIISNG